MYYNGFLYEYRPLDDVVFSIQDGDSTCDENSDVEVEEDLQDTSFKHDASDIETESGSDEEPEDNLSVDTSSQSPAEDIKFVVFLDSLIPLLKTCLKCGKPAIIEKLTTIGSALVVIMHCSEGHDSVWQSQPKIGDQYAGNLLMSAATLFSGSTFTNLMEFAAISKLQMFGKTLFYEMQRKYLHPAINLVYENYQNTLIADSVVAAKSFKLSGDGRCDSPGFNAKYGMYSMMDNRTSKVLHFEVINVGETGSSSRMEKEGLIRCLDKMKACDIKIYSLTTDQHVQIKKHMREQEPEIRHQFDTWHVSKGMKKKLVKNGKKKVV